MKTILSILLSFCLVISASAWNPMVVTGGSSSCNLYETETNTQDVGLGIGRYSSGDFSGFIYTPDENICLCQVDQYVRQVAGNISSKNYYVRVFTIDGNNDVDSIVGTSAVLSGADISASSWISYTFTTCLNLTSGEDYAITAFVDTDADLADDPEYDGSNYYTWAFDNELANANKWTGSGLYTWDASIPYIDAALDAEDEPEVKLYTQ